MWLCPSFAKTPPQKPVHTLKDYIQKVCPKNCITTDNLLKIVKDISKKYHVDYRMLIAIIRVESSFDKTAVNRSNVGLNQVNLRYHKPKFKGTDYYLPSENIRVGAIIYRDCLVKYKSSISKALKCYNGNADPMYSTKVIAAHSNIVNLTRTSTNMK